MTRYVCIHGHFYQPPRENPWLEVVEAQDSALPYHDWNERITAECYGPNTAAQVLDHQGLIARLVNTYSAISFNVGPTLLSWLQTQAPEAYDGMVQADHISRERFGGHGSAMAQAYNHLIMPLANRRDKATQVIWGLRDFEYRFGRPAEGMWLPETAVDLETLEVLAEQGVAFTVLAPHQATRIRPLSGGDWEPLHGAAIDTRRAYLQRLPSGRSISLLFYDGPASKAIAFDRLLASGEQLTSRLLAGFDTTSPEPQLVHVATDGETYGHHHRFGDMALARTIDLLEQKAGPRLTNYGEFLALHPPEWEVDIAEATAWSCAHGVERWRSDCGCNAGGGPGWHQRWRAPLRAALDWLRDGLAVLFEQAAAELLADPWAARDAFIELILDRSEPSRTRFLLRHARPGLTAEQQVRALTLLEMQRQTLLMYTSCGWFFDDIAGIEASQVLLYAARAIELAQTIDGYDRTAAFERLLEAAPGNTAGAPNGRVVYERGVAAALVHSQRAVAHAALTTLTGMTTTPTPRWVLTQEPPPALARRRGDTLAQGLVQVTDALTGAVTSHGYVAVRAGGAEPRVWTPVEAAQSAGAIQAFHAGGAAAVAHLMARYHHAPTGLEALFPDDRRRLLAAELDAALGRTSRALRQHYPSLLPPGRVGSRPFVPDQVRTAMQAVLPFELRSALADTPNPDRVAPLLAAAEAWGVVLDAEALGYVLTETINRLSRALAAAPQGHATHHALAAALASAQAGHPPLPVNRWLATKLVVVWMSGSSSAAEAAHLQVSASEDAQDISPMAVAQVLGLAPTLSSG